MRRWLPLLILLLAAFLRLYRLDQVPPAPYWEEVALGYDAYSIAETGRDHHGHWLPLVAFESFGDWKPGGYIYALVPFIKVLGLNVWSLRLPAALSGVLIVWGIGELARIASREWLPTKKSPQSWWLDWFPVVCMAVAAISPWLIMFSRAAWEVNLATCLILWGMIFGLKVATGQTKKPWWFVGAAALLVLSMYTYHAARIVAPVLGLGLLVTWWSYSHDFIRSQWKTLLLSTVVAGVLLSPFVASLGSNTTTQRFAETSIFSNVDIINESNQRIEAAHGSLVSRVLYHRRVLFGREIISNWLSHLQPDFLFVTGDKNARHTTVFMGQLYHVEAVFLLLGAYVFFKKWHRLHGLLLLWLVIGIFPASITYAAPHALRILPAVPIFMYLIGLGVIEAVSLFQTLSRNFKPVLPLGIVAIVAIYLFELLMFWRFYMFIYPKLYSSDWLYGYEQVMTKLETYHQQQPELPIVMTRKYGRPAMYYWFYTQTDPRAVQALDPTVPKDQGEFLVFEALSFTRGTGEIPRQPSVIVVSEDELPELKQKFGENAFQVVDMIKDPRGKTIWNIVRMP